MSENQNPLRYRAPGSDGSRPAPRSFDIKPAGKPHPGQFPAPGMTLSTYRTPTKPDNTPRRSWQAPAADSSRGGQATKTQLPPRGSAKQPGRLKRIFTPKRVILTLLAIFLLVGGWLGFKFIYNAHKLFGGNIFSAFTTTKLRGEDTGRVNILLAGNSADDPGHQGGNLTDSIMIVSISTKDNSAYMLSIPRDLYVSIPGNGHGKINEVYPDGEQAHFNQEGYAPGGMGLLEKVIKQDFGITCNYYALVDYSALRDAVNDVGGIDVNIQSSDPRGLYDPSVDYDNGNKALVRLTNGQHHLSGAQALGLARARGDAYGSYGFAGSDFDRTANQRMLIMALRAKATSAGVLANPIRLGNLFDAIGSHVKTDFQLSEVHRLYDITKDINGNNIQSAGLNNAYGKNLLMNYTSYSGESALVPAAGLDDYADIRAYIRRISSNNPVAREGAQVVLLNGTGTVGLASKQESSVTGKGLTVMMVADADNSSHTTSQIIDASGGKMPGSLAALKSLYPKATVTATNPYVNRFPSANFLVVLGSDQLAPKATTTGR